MSVMKHFRQAAVHGGVRLSRRLQLSRLLPAVVLAGFAFLAGHAGRPASVEPAAPSPLRAMAEAAGLTDAAERELEERRPVLALAAFQRAYELSADPTLLLEIGRLERQLGNSARAAHAFEQFLVRGSDRASPERVQLTRRQLRDSSATTARLSLQTNVHGATVELEPQRGVATRSGFAVDVLLDAGDRTLLVSKPGYESRTLQLSLIPGEVRSLRVDLEKAAGRSETSPAKPRLALWR
jgi:hypothetical protein